MRIRHFKSAQAALNYAKELRQRGLADLFRGQQRDWPTICPSLYRGDVDARSKAEAILREFEEWANLVPQMAAYWGRSDEITAIAQHYGIPTQFLDLTTEPEIAYLFAAGEPGDDEPEGQGTIYCFDRRSLQEIEGVELLEIDVVNLWRLQAQSGLFLRYLNPDVAQAVRARALALLFPRQPLSVDQARTLYPIRKSPLELVIDQWIFRHRIGSIQEQIAGAVTYQLLIKRYTYPGAFRWRRVPEFTPEWIRGDPRWVFPTVDSLGKALSACPIPLHLETSNHVGVAFENLRKQVLQALQGEAGWDGIKFELSMPGQSQLHENASLILNRCWDGLRSHPYQADCIARSLGAIALGFIWQFEVGGDPASWQEALWGDLDGLDAAPVGGHLEGGFVSQSELRHALSSDHYSSLTSFFRRKAEGDPFFLMDYVVDPWVLFDFEPFARVFIEQMVPSSVSYYWKSILEAGEEPEESYLWGLVFNPALLGTVTRAGYRFNSPLVAEANPERLVLIAADMTKSDIREAFYSCLPHILAGSEPFTVKFVDYAHDERPIWQIPRAVAQCKIINEIGGISVLEVFPGLTEEPVPETPFESGGLGAFHIWAIANNRLQECAGIPLASIRRVIDEFWSDLMKANNTLEAGARAEADWPGPTPG